MCVFKYHAFIFLIRPPRWQRETLASCHLLDFLHGTSFLVSFYENDMSPFLLTLFRTGVPYLPPLLLYILLLCDWRYVFKQKWILWFRSNVYVSYIGEMGEYFSDSKPMVAWPRGLFTAVSTCYREMTNRRDHTLEGLIIRSFVLGHFKNKEIMIFTQ